jgi:site-specific DNA recombinase
VYSIDRLGRNLLETLLFLRDLDDLNIECWSVEKEELLSGDDFILQIQGAVASKERQEILKRTQDGLKRAIKAGKYSGGIIPYGYKLNPETKKLEVEEEEAVVIQQIYRWVVKDGMSTVLIADRLNALSYPTRYTKDGRLLRQKGKRDGEKTQGIWRAGRVLNMIKNPCYTGEWSWGKRSLKKKKPELIRVVVPNIIDQKTFEIAQQRLKSHRLFNPEIPHREYLLRGLITCGVCGKKYCGSVSKIGPNNSGEKTYYRCNGVTQWRKLGMKKCVAMSLNALELENIVWDDVKTFCKDPNTAISQLMAQRKPLDDSIPE